MGLKSDGASTNVILLLFTEEGAWRGGVKRGGGCSGAVLLVITAGPIPEEWRITALPALPHPRPKTNPRKAGTFFFHQEPRFCICHRERMNFKPAFSSDNRNTILSEKFGKYENIKGRPTRIPNKCLALLHMFPVTYTHY